MTFYIASFVAEIVTKEETFCAPYVEGNKQEVEARPFYFKLVAKTIYGDKKYLVEPVENITGSFLAWSSSKDISVCSDSQLEEIKASRSWVFSFKRPKVKKESLQQPSLQQPSLSERKLVKLRSIDSKTESLISKGYVHNGVSISASAAAQVRWSSLNEVRNSLTYPFLAASADNLSFLNISSPEEVASLYHNMASFVYNHVGTGAQLKKRVTEASDLASLNAIVDDRT